MDNYPDTTYETDPDAPWNQPDPWIEHSCDECIRYNMIPSEIGNSKYGFCTENGEFTEGDEEACMWFEDQV